MEFLLSRLRSYVISFNTSSFWVRCGRCGTPTRPFRISMNSSHDPPLHHRNLSRCLSPADRRLIKFRNHGLKRRLRSAWYFFFLCENRCSEITLSEGEMNGRAVLPSSENSCCGYPFLPCLIFPKVTGFLQFIW